MNALLESLLKFAGNSKQKRSRNDRERMSRYICERISPMGTRVELTDGGEDGQPYYADLTPLYDPETDTWELIIERNSDWVTLWEVYEYFRHRDMTHDEWFREVTWVNPSKEFDRKVSRLSPNELKIFDATDERVPLTGEKVAAIANCEYSGQTKGILSLLVKLGLLVKTKGGYVRSYTRRKSQD